MGLMDIVKKLLTGATDEENARNKARMRELFNECVPEGDQYTLIYCLWRILRMQSSLRSRRTVILS